MAAICINMSGQASDLKRKPDLPQVGLVQQFRSALLRVLSIRRTHTCSGLVCPDSHRGSWGKGREEILFEVRCSRSGLRRRQLSLEPNRATNRKVYAVQIS